MRRVSLWLIATVTIMVLLFSYHTSTSSRNTATEAPTEAQAPGVVGNGAAGGASPAPSPSRSHSSRSPSKPAATSVANGTVVQTQWGPVQVQVHISGQKITDAAALIFPSGTARDEAINSYALPLLRQQVLSAQSAQIDGVSGATVTSDGYRQSLQAALVAAHVGG